MSENRYHNDFHPYNLSFLFFFYVYLSDKHSLLFNLFKCLLIIQNQNI